MKTLHRRALPILILALASVPPAWDASPDSQDEKAPGTIEVHGALREMMHQGRTDARVGLDTLLPDPTLYAVGALAELAGEITVVGGTAYLSYPEGEEKVRTAVATESAAGAALLVAARVPAWRNVRTSEAIPFAELDEAMARLAARAGLKKGRRFPFMMTGEFSDLRWHVIDGRRLAAGGSSHQDHQAAAVRSVQEAGPATLIGFYSTTDEGVFTHMGSRTHVHAVVEEPLSSGHVDHVSIPAGTIVSFPDEAGD